MNTADLIIKDGTCVTHDRVFKADIAVKKGKILKIGILDNYKAKKTLSAKGLHILPGAFDTQVHFREPGQEYKEDLNSGSRSAIAGGITTVFDMPNNNPSISTKKLFKKKLSDAKNRMFCNYAFYFGAEKDNTAEIKKVEKEDGCCGIKVFVGVSTGTLLVENYSDIKKIMKSTKKMISFHSEDQGVLNKRKKYIKRGDPKSHPIWRNERVCLTCTKHLVKLANLTKKKIHILHITTAEEIELLNKNKKFISYEVTPQHLTLSSPSCYNKLGSLAQMNPAIRSNKHLSRLRKALKNNEIDIVGSDHAPHTLAEKKQEYPDSPSGMPGGQTLMPILLNEVSKKTISINNVVQLTSYNPIKRFKVKNKGLIKEGYDADFTFVDLTKTKKISNKLILSKCGWTPFHGMKIKGWPVGTMINGNKVFWNEKIIGKPIGKPIKFN